MSKRTAAEIISELREKAGYGEVYRNQLMKDAADRLEAAEQQLSDQKDEYEGLIDVAEINYKELEAELVKEKNENRKLLDPTGLLLPPILDESHE